MTEQVTGAIDEKIENSSETFYWTQYDRELMPWIRREFGDFFYNTPLLSSVLNQYKLKEQINP